MSQTIQLPDYRVQSAKVRERFRALKQRPVKLEVRGLCREFESASGTVKALHDIHFNVYRREFLSIIGPSGCGKSTLIRILSGLDEPTSGSVLLDGKEVRGPGADRGMVFQGYTLFPWLTVKKNVMFGLEVNGGSGCSVEQDALQWIELVGLSHAKDAYPNQLSGGMKQRVAIARALANQPKILLMDEPFGALDAQTRAQMQSYLLQIWQNVDVTIVFITHDLDEAVLLSDRVVVLKAHPGEVQEVIEVPVPHPRHLGQLITPEFLSTRNRLEELIHPKSSGEEKRLPIPRMTQVGDDVF